MKQHRFKILGLVVGLIAGYAFAAIAAPATVTVKPGQPAYEDGTVMQNTHSMAPIKGFVRSGSTVLTQGGAIAVFNTYTGNSWFKRAKGCATNSTGVSVPIRVAYGNVSTSTIEPTGCFDSRINRSFSSVTVKTFDNTSTSVANGTYYWSHQRE